MNANERIATLEKRVNDMDAKLATIDDHLGGIKATLDTLVSVSTVAKAGGNFLIDNLPRIVAGIIAGLTSAGIVLGGQNFVG